MFDMEQLYPYILAEIRRLLASDHRQLFLKDSKVRGYLSEIGGSEIAELERGSFPAIEALAFPVITMLRDVELEARDDNPDDYGISPEDMLYLSSDSGNRVFSKKYVETTIKKQDLFVL